MKKYRSLILLTGCLFALTACHDDVSEPDIQVTDNDYVGKDVGNFTAEEWYPGGVLGTTENTTVHCYEDETPAVTQLGMSDAFTNGETVFEHKYTLNTNPYKGLGPIFLGARVSTVIRIMAMESAKPNMRPIKWVMAISLHSFILLEAQMQMANYMTRILT